MKKTVLLGMLLASLAAAILFGYLVISVEKGEGWVFACAVFAFASGIWLCVFLDETID